MAPVACGSFRIEEVDRKGLGSKEKCSGTQPTVCLPLVLRASWKISLGQLGLEERRGLFPVMRRFRGLSLARSPHFS